MKSRLALLLLLLCILNLGVQAQKIKVEYNKGLDFSKFKTFAWGHTMRSPVPCWPSPFGAIEQELTKRGLRKVEADPDAFIPGVWLR